MPRKRVKQRGNGQGSAVQIKPGNWKAIVTLGYTDAGVPIRKTKSGFKTKTEALEYIPVLRGEPQKEKAPIKLIEAEQAWQKTLQISQSTIFCYKAGLKIFDELLNEPLANISIDDYQELLDASDKGKRTLQNAKIALGLIYKWAIPRGHIPNNLNIATFLKIHADGEVVHRLSFTDEQLAILKSHADSMPMARMIYCHCYLGFRPTAFLALTCDDYWPEEEYFVGGIKTEAGRNRIVPVSSKIKPYIARFIRESGGTYLFQNNGEKMSLAVYRARFYETMEQLGFQRPGEHTYSPHTCRHTFATMLKRIDIPEKDKLTLIGHTTDAMLRYYQDTPLEDLRRGISLL